MSEVHPSTTNPKVGEYYIERGFVNDSIWTIRILKVDGDEIYYKIISSTDEDSNVIGKNNYSISHYFKHRFRPLTPNEKVALL